MSGRYAAHITSKRIKIRLGTFGTPEEAALAYDAAARSFRGSRARITNFPAPSMDADSCGGCVAGASNKTVAAENVGIIRRGLAIDLNEPPPLSWL